MNAAASHFDAPGARVGVHAGRRGRAFTLIELIVVIIMISILAGFIVPRIINTGKRQAEIEATEVARLLSVAARRSALAAEVVAVEYDGTGPRLSMVVLRNVDTGRGLKQAWVADPLTPPVELTAVNVVRAVGDGQVLGTAGGRWWVDFDPSQPRPVLWLLVGDDRAAESEGWQIELLPEETSASKRPATDPSRASLAGLLRIDLDATNQGERAW